MISKPSPRHIARAATIVMLFFVISRVLGLIRDIVISHQFGTSRMLDAYFAAFNVPDFIFNIVAGGALGSAFIPTFAAALASNDERQAWRLASSIITAAIVFLAALSVGIAIFALPIVSATVARGFTAQEQQLTADLMRWMLITPIVFGVSGILMGMLNSYQHFALPALAPVLYNASITLGALFLAPAMGVYGLVVGVVVGAVLHLAVQVPWLIRKRLEIGDWRLVENVQSLISNLRSPDVLEVGRLMLPRTLGIAAVQINFLVNTILASTLPSGRIAALSYAWRLMLLPVGIVGQSLATAVFPSLSEQSARNDLGDFRRTFSMAFRATLYLTIPATVGLFILGKPFVALLFQRGEFDAQSTVETAWALQFFSVALFAHSGLEIVTRAFYAMHDTATPVIVGVAAMALNIVLSLVLIAPLAQGGLALANSIATILEVVILLVILHRRMGDIDQRQILVSVARIVIAASAMSLFLVPFANYFESSNAVFVALVGGLLSAVIYLGVTLLLRSDETAFFMRRLMRKSEIRNQQS